MRIRGFVLLAMLACSACTERSISSGETSETSETDQTGETDQTDQTGESDESGDSGEPVDPALCEPDDASAWASGPDDLGYPHGRAEAECLVTNLAEDAAGWTITLDCAELGIIDIRFDANPKPNGPPMIVGEQLGLDYLYDGWQHGSHSELALWSLDDNSIRLLSAGGNDGAYDTHASLLNTLPSAPVDVELTTSVCPEVELECGATLTYASVRFSTSDESVLLLPGNSFAEIGVERRFAVWGTSYSGRCDHGASPEGWVTIAALLEH